MGSLGGGDDGVGPAVLEALRPAGVDAVWGDPSRLVEALMEPGRVVLVDAVRGPTPGRVHVLREDQLAGPLCPVSSHAMSVPQAVGLARVLAPDGAVLVVVAVEIAPPSPGVGLSPLVQAAVPHAVAAVLAALEEPHA
jgi:hydrogenase maturation protease